MRRTTTVPLLLLGALALPACTTSADAARTGTGAAAGTVQAAAAFYPLAFVLERVGGARVSVEGLTPPGAEPHDLELGARQTARVTDADLLVHLGGFQPAVDELAKQLDGTALDVAGVVDLLPAEEGSEERGGDDPHVWLDPLRLAEVGDAVAGRLAEVDPDGAADYRSGAAALRTDLEQVDTEYRTGLRTCERRDVVVSHTAFGYLTDRYDLAQVGISGLSPDEEPSPARVGEAVRAARASGATTIFFETLVSPAVAETVAQEVGATTAVLDPLEGQPDGGDYLSGMRSNLEALRAALACA